MINQTEQDERKYLAEVISKLRGTLGDISDKVRQYDQDIRRQKEYLWENKSGMDHVEKISVRQSVDMAILTGDTIVAKSRRIQKLLRTPYFGRFDFKNSSSEYPDPIYVGIHSFYDEENDRILVYDWRAPISSMFYDFETGQAEFRSPAGIVTGDITLKRQYRIREGEMEFMIESDVNIHDDVLQKELSCAADDKMKNIVATIQRDQNAIIRNEKSEVLIIQGVAGSGKTSIALHRIAFLLYRFKETISSKDLLIISPNKVFADYISNVLPELGEESIPEIGIEELAHELLEGEVKFQKFFEQVALLLEEDDKAFGERIKAKASHDFLKKLDEYIVHAKDTYFSTHDIIVNGRQVPAGFIQERYDLYKDMPIVKCLEKLAKNVEMNIRIYRNYNVSSREKRLIKETVLRMFKFTSLRGLYEDFYSWQGKYHYFKKTKDARFEYSDVFPFIYLKMHWSGMKENQDVRHLLIDEMQDYTPVQYALLAKLYPCKKTILGDANQSVNPYSSSNAKDIQTVFPESDCVKLCKSYRSTYEITKFAQAISPNSDLEAIERHGKEPVLRQFNNEDQEFEEILSLVRKFKESDYHSLGIICKTEKLASTLCKNLKEKERNIYLLSHESESFIQGIVVCTAHMAKGLEFDQVIIPQVTEQNYCSEIDKKMLYVACTRAMHILIVSYAGCLTSFIKEKRPQTS